MLRLIEFDENLDLSFFYEQCKKEGLKNNSSQDRIWNKFKSYDKHMTWILYNDELPVASYQSIQRLILIMVKWDI